MNFISRLSFDDDVVPSFIHLLHYEFEIPKDKKNKVLELLSESFLLQFHLKNFCSAIQYSVQTFLIGTIDIIFYLFLL